MISGRRWIEDDEDYDLMMLKLGSETIEITATADNPPIQIPETGGSFTYDLLITNDHGSSITEDIWTDIIRPDEVEWGPLNQYNDTTITDTLEFDNLSVTVPGNYPAGTYELIAKIGDYSGDVINLSSFTFEKLATDGPSGSPEETDLIALVNPYDYELSGAYPNPFNPTTTIGYQLAEDGPVKLTVHDVHGRLVAKVIDGWRQSGHQEVTFDASELPSGMYIYRLQAGSFTAQGKMVLVK